MGITNCCSSTSDKSYHSSISKKRKYEHQESVSNNPININEACEDELLLLPGVTRQTAQNILQYREINKGFKEIKDLCQVSGISDEIYKSIHYDVTISPSLNTKHQCINLNSASFNDLSTIPGLTSKLVSKIIKRRERKGLFSCIEDLLKIKGINGGILSTIRPHVTVDQQQISNRHNINTPSVASILLETFPPELRKQLLSPSSSSPNKANNDNSKQNTFRFASWNLQQLTIDKVQNYGVKEVICRIILENNFSLIGIQDIGNKESLDYIIQELNNPTIPSIKSSHHGKWKSILIDIDGETNEYLGFIYDESIGIEFLKTSLLTIKCFSRLPYITTFRILNKIDLNFVNMFLKLQASDEEKLLKALPQMIQNTVEQNYTIIFGSFNMRPTVSQFDAFIQNNYSYVIEQSTDISLKTPEGSVCIDNIWFSPEMKSLSTGNSGVIRNNLTSMWIPTGWSWGGLVSDHCPIWIEFNLL